MYFPFYIARRYLISKKSSNVINIITYISIGGIAGIVMCIIIILSIFNGFETVIKNLFNTFDPDIRIEIREGKTFSIQSPGFNEIRRHPNVACFVETLEENALIRYADKQDIVIIKGVGENYAELNGIDSMLVDGIFMLQHKGKPYAVVGQGVAYKLSLGLRYIDPAGLVVYMPERKGDITHNPEKAFKKRSIIPIGVFSIQQEFDSKYMLVPIVFARELLDYENAVTAVEIRLKDKSSVRKTQEEIQTILGNDFQVLDRFQQHEFLYKVMRSEKLIIFLFLSIILIVMAFNITGSLTMLIIDKKEDIHIIRSMGAHIGAVRQIFLTEGWLISIFGTLIGLLFGAVVCYIQQEFGLIRLSGGQSFVVDAYPVEMRWMDFAAVFVFVGLVGLALSWLPARYITNRYLKR